MTEMNKKNFEELENLDYFAVQGEGSTNNKALIKRALAAAKKNLENAEGICIFSNEQEQDVVLFVNSEEAVSRFLKKKRDEIIGLWYNPIIPVRCRTGFIMRVKDVTRIQVDYREGENFHVRQLSVTEWRKKLNLLPSRKKKALVRATSCFGLAEAMMANAVR